MKLRFMTDRKQAIRSKDASRDATSCLTYCWEGCILICGPTDTHTRKRINIIDLKILRGGVDLGDPPFPSINCMKP